MNTPNPSNTNVVVAGIQGAPGIAGLAFPTLGATTIYVDPVNGNDSGNGSITAPYKTGGKAASVVQGVTFTGPLVVNLLGDLPATDVTAFRSIRFAQGSGAHSINGTPQNVAGSASTCTSGTTASNPASNVAWAFEDTGKASSYFAAYLGYRIRITSGPRAGTSATIIKDLGSSRCRITQPFANDLVSGTWTPSTIVSGDAYELQRGSVIPWGAADFTGSGDENVTFTVNDLCFAAVTPQYAWTLLSVKGVQHQLNRCDFPGPDFDFGPITSGPLGISYSGDPFIYGILANCSMQGQAVVAQSDLGIVGGALWNNGAAINVSSGGTIILDNDVILQTVDWGGPGTVTDLGSSLLIGQAAFFDNVGHGLVVGPGETCILQDAIANFGGGPHRLWGAGNSGYGVNVQAGGRLVCQATIPTLTGTLGDFALGGTATNAFGVSPTTGAVVGPTTTTWAHLGTTLGAGTGFGGTALNPVNGATAEKLA